MKSILKVLLLTVIPLWAATVLADTNELALIPEPQKVQQLDGTFTLMPRTAIYADRASRKTAELLAARLRQSTGYPLKVHWKMLSAVPEDAILLTTKKANAQLGAEGYDLTVATNVVVIRAPAQEKNLAQADLGILFANYAVMVATLVGIRGYTPCRCPWVPTGFSA